MCEDNRKVMFLFQCSSCQPSVLGCNRERTDALSFCRQICNARPTTKQKSIFLYAKLGRSGVVAARTTGRATRAADKFVFFMKITAIRTALGTGCTLTEVTRSTQPSIL